MHIALKMIQLVCLCDTTVEVATLERLNSGPPPPLKCTYYSEARAAKITHSDTGEELDTVCKLKASKSKETGNLAALASSSAGIAEHVHFDRLTALDEYAHSQAHHARRLRKERPTCRIRSREDFGIHHSIVQTPRPEDGISSGST